MGISDAFIQLCEVIFTIKNGHVTIKLTSVTPTSQVTTFMDDIIIENVSY